MLWQIVLGDLVIRWLPERKIVSEEHVQIGGWRARGEGYVVLSYVWAIYYYKLCWLKG
jgi:hypothetical protein